MKPSLMVGFLAPLLLLPSLPAVGKADDAEFIREAAFQIDSRVAGWYRKQKLEVPAVTDDRLFCGAHSWW